MDKVANNIATNFINFNCKICTGRHIIIIFLLFGFQFIRAQDTLLNSPLSIYLTNYPVYDALKVIENEIGYNFSYNADIIDAERIVTVNSQGGSLKNILGYILEDSTLIYKVIGKHIVIYKNVPGLQDNYKVIIPDSLTVIEIKGQIVDNNSLRPIEYANICIIGKSIGTISNSSGNFILKVSPDYINDTVGVSFLGYETYQEPVINFITSEKVIALESGFINIQEVIIRKIDPVSLLRNAYENIATNYRNSDVILTSFYRESVMESNRYIIIGEAVIQTFKSAYSESYKYDQIKIIKARTSKDINRSDSIILKLKGGLSTTLLIDIIKNPATFLVPDCFHLYSYKMADMMIDNDKKSYVVKFEQKEGVDYIPYNGKIYLDLNSLAIKGVDFSLCQNKIEKATDYLVVRKPRFFKVRPLKAEYQVKFRELNNKYYLNFIRCETEFRIRKKKQLFGKVFNTVIEMAVTDIDTTDVKRFRAKEVAKTMNIFTEQVSDYNDSFWEEYNFIKPDEPLEEAIKKLIPAGNDSGIQLQD